jgi:hypothetical protein
MHFSKFLFLAVSVTMGMTAAAQEPVLLSQPDLNLITDGTVAAMARAPDGSVIVGGHFSSVGGVARANIAKLRADGSLDPDWNPGTDDQVVSLAVDPTGAVYAGGYFLRAGTLNRQFMAKFDLTGVGAVDSNWDARATSPIDSIAVDSSGAVFVGGTFFEAVPGFATIGGQPRNYLAKLTGNGDADPTWNPNPNSPVAKLAVDGTGSLFIGPDLGGVFIIDGNGRHVAKLPTTGVGEFDTQWQPAEFYVLKSMVLDGLGNLYLSVQSPGQNIRKVSATGIGTDVPGWDPGCSNADSCLPGTLAIDPKGKIYVTGYFPGTIGGASRTGIARLEPNGTADSTWISSVGETVFAMVSGLDSQVYVGGNFKSAGGMPRFGLAVLSSTGSALAPVDVEMPGTTRAFATQSDGSVIVGGRFKRSGALTRHNLLRVRADSSIDADWHPDPNGDVRSIAVDGDGSVYVAGPFSNVGGQPRNGLAKLAGTGPGLAVPGWDVSINSTPQSIVFDATSNALFIAGAFSSVGGSTINGLAKIGSSGVVDTTWNPSLSSSARVYALFADGAGSIYAGGSFSGIGGLARSNLARLPTSGTGSADPVWAPQTSAVNVTSVGPDGRIYVGTSSGIARFASTGAGASDPTWQTSVTYGVNALAFDAQQQFVYACANPVYIGLPEQHNLIRASLVGAGTVDPSWQPGVHSSVNRLLWTADGRLLVGGSFDTMDGQPRFGFAAFGPDRIFANSFD